ncbi:MAG TPA: DUF5916 domain-containing protein, partial [Gemmatimonadaceae bacterium]
MSAQTSASQAAPAGRETAPPSPARTAVTTATAARAKSPPVIDGSGADAAWAETAPITDFRTFQPVDDGEPRYKTEARVLNDESNIYVLVRAFDPHPDSIVPLLSRRDVKTQSDQIKVMIDSYHDRRTGYEFAVNPAGVKRDYYLYDDVREDASWDAVWDVATRIDSLGWVAEFRIPLSQLRYPKAETHTFGLMIMRDLARTNERFSWPAYRQQRPGVASQFGEISGLVGLGAPRRLEIVPYAITRNVSTRDESGFGRKQQQSLGADIKYGLSSNLTLDATVNPDFGQVEADPAVLNLTAFESFFEERRPFFIEGTGIFQFDPNNAQLFYPRRIGRAPQLGGLVENPNALIPGSTTILGAAKVTGRLSSGTSLGLMTALTQKEKVGATVVEPQAEYGVLRLSHDFRKGESGLGFMLTQVSRQLDETSDDFLRRNATVGGIDARHRFGNGKFSASGSLAYSKVNGTADAIARAQRSSVHLFQRPDADHLDYDPTRTSLKGTALAARLEKVDGVIRGGSSYQRWSPGFEANDLGFLSQADQQSLFSYVSWRTPQPKSFYRRASAQLSVYNQFNIDGMTTVQTPELDADVTFKGSQSFSIAIWRDNTGGVYCDRCARGGPALRLSPSSSVLVNLASDPRGWLQKQFAAIYTTADGGRSQLWRVRPYFIIRAASNIGVEIGARYQKNHDNTQWYGNVGSVGSPDAHYLFAHLDQDLLSFQTRFSITATPNLSLQFYGEPFVTTGQYSDVREISGTPDAPSYDARFVGYTPPPNTALSFKYTQLRSNSVVRWEYRPGSTLFLVWTHGRTGAVDQRLDRPWTTDYRDLF